MRETVSGRVFSEGKKKKFICDGNRSPWQEWMFKVKTLMTSLPDLNWSTRKKSVQVQVRFRYQCLCTLICRFGFSADLLEKPRVAKNESPDVEGLSPDTKQRTQNGTKMELNWNQNGTNSPRATWQNVVAPGVGLFVRSARNKSTVFSGADDNHTA